jgi:Na+-translocating ferredoxin:NAD+ oxidoreductase subunit E
VNTLLHELKRGILDENPVFVLVLGLCASLATSTSIKSALGMGLATTFVLVFSNIFISIIRNAIPSKIRIPAFIVVIAAFVIIVQQVMAAYVPELNKQLGIFIPLIVVNCIILARAEAYASKNNLIMSTLDGIGMGLGFIAALLLLAVIREFLGANKFLGLTVIPGFQPATIVLLAPGGFFTIAAIMAVRNWLISRPKGRK